MSRGTCAARKQRQRRCTGQRGYSLSQKRISPLEPQEKDFILSDCGLKNCTRCTIRCLLDDVSKRFDFSSIFAVALPACRRSYAISVYFGFYQFCCCLPRRHCCARRDMRTIGRRRLGCTPTRSAERHPQGVCRIRKASEPPTAAQQRMMGAEASRIAMLTRQRRAQVFSFRRHKDHSSLRLPIKTFLLGVQGGHSLLRKRMAPLSAPPCAARGTRSSALRCRNAILHTFHRAVNNNSASFIWKESISIWKSEKNSGARCRL